MALVCSLSPDIGPLPPVRLQGSPAWASDGAWGGSDGYGGHRAAVRAKLEASFADEAEIIFTTASSSGRRFGIDFLTGSYLATYCSLSWGMPAGFWGGMEVAFLSRACVVLRQQWLSVVCPCFRIMRHLSHGFDVLVIDEAAQASEVAVLPPLSLSCQRCVLIGDPQQLPATVISRTASALNYRSRTFPRSLFDPLALPLPSFRCLQFNLVNHEIENACSSISQKNEIEKFPISAPCIPWCMLLVSRKSILLLSCSKLLKCFIYVAFFLPPSLLACHVILVPSLFCACVLTAGVFWSASSRRVVPRSFSTCSFACTPPFATSRPDSSTKTCCRTRPLYCRAQMSPTTQTLCCAPSCSSMSRHRRHSRRTRTERRPGRLWPCSWYVAVLASLPA